MYNSTTKSEFHNQNNIVHWKPAGRDAKVYDNILHAIGNTPLVKLNRIPKDYGLDCEMYAKCEFMNPGGSIKDRIAYTMVVDAENRGEAKEGTRFVEPTSGNTGIGIALIAAIKGYNSTIVTPDKNSEEKLNTMHLLGADIVQTPGSASCEDPDYFVNVAAQIVKDDPHHNMCLDQYSNPVNPRTHLEHTANEILDALGRVEMAVIGAGTGGTVTGVAHGIKKHCPDCTVVAVDPKGSTLWGKVLFPYYVEGIGGDFIPDVLHKDYVNSVQSPNDYEAFNMAREVIRKEGLLCGGSSGAAIFAAVKAAKEHNLGPGQKVVVVLPDGIRNYMSKFVCDQWMEAHLFKEPPQHDKIEWYKQPLSALEVDTTVPRVKLNASCREAVAAMGSTHNVALVVDDNWNHKGAISLDQLRNAATNPKKDENLDLNDPVSKHLIHKCYKVIENVFYHGYPTVGLVSRILDITTFVVKVERVSNPDDPKEVFKAKGIITSDIVWAYILRNQDH